MKRLLGCAVSGLLIGAIFITSSASATQDFVEPGRFGVEGVMTQDGIHAGIGYWHDKFEAVIDFDGSINTLKTGDFGIESRFGYRINGGNYNYFSFGVDYQVPIISEEGGSHFSGSYLLGPYVGFQRYFPGTPVMLTFFIMPAAYFHQAAPDSANTVNAWQFFQQGGLGVSYLF